MKHMVIFGILVLIIVISGCSTQNTQLPQSLPPTATPPIGGLGIKKDIGISGFAFNPEIVTIPKGATVIWTNMDSAAHTIISDTGAEINSDSISNGKTFAHTFNTAGTYNYHCGIHPSMKGTIIVE